jgi:hypothetical protein
LSFRSESISFIKKQAVQVTDTRDFELVHLAAYLFAIGTQLALNQGSARLLIRDELPPAWTSREELLDHLAQLSESLDASALYWTLISALLTIESLICRQPSYRDAMPASTPLDSFPAGSFRGLSGEVLHWMRPPSVLAVERVRRFLEARKRPPAPAPHPEIYLSRLALYWDPDPRLPRVVPVKPSLRTFPLFEKSGRDAAERKSFRVALCPMPGSFHPQFRIHPNGRHFHALSENSISDPGSLHEHLEVLVEAALAQDVNLLVLPELSVDPNARGRLKQLLRQGLTAGGGSLYGIVAGSFHIWGDPAEGEEALPVNEAALLDPAGETSAQHWKKGQFRVTSAQVNAAPHFFPVRPAKLAREIFEEIRYGSELQVLDTSLGRVALLICADAIAADDKGYLPVVRHLRPDLLIVVSMTPETHPFDAFAEDMSRYWIGTLFVNAHCVCQRPEQAGWTGRLRRAASLIAESIRDRFGLRSAVPNLVACDLALQELDGLPPTRLRWRYDRDEAECIYFNPPDRNRNWRPISRALGETGFSWLTKGTQRLGTVIDLGVHWDAEDQKQKERRKFSLDAPSQMS